jgi:hypothetical protein
LKGRKGKMAKVEYKFELYIITHEAKDTKGNIIRDVERINIPVDSFEVDGGANRKISLTTRDEISTASEFEQARSFNNIIYYVPPTRDFLALKLVDLRKNGPEQFSMTFVISIYSNKKLTKTLRLSAESSWFFRMPEPVGGEQPVLKLWMRFRDLQLLHGNYDPKFKRVVHKTM